MDNQQVRGLSKTRQTLLISVISIVFTIVTIIFLMIGIISIGVTYTVPLNTDNTACALKSGYGLFVVAGFVELFMLIFESVAVCLMDVPRNCCRCERFQIRFIMHFVAAAMIMVGTVIYGSGDRDRVQWSFWMVFCAAILAMINGIIWSITLKLDRYFNKGPSTKTQGWGLTNGTTGGGLVGTSATTGNLGGAPLGGGSIGGGLDTGFGGDLGGGNLGGNLGGNGIGGDLGGGNLDSNLGSNNIGGDIGGLDSGTVDLAGNLDDNPLGGGLNSDDLGGGSILALDNSISSNLNSGQLDSTHGLDLGAGDPILKDELFSVPIDPILQDELQSAPKENIGTSGLQLDDLPTGIDSGLNPPFSQLPETFGLNVDLIKGVDTAGLDIAEPDDDVRL